MIPSLLGRKGASREGGEGSQIPPGNPFGYPQGGFWGGPAEIPKLGVPEGGRGWWDVTQGAQTARIPRGGAWAEAEPPAHSQGPRVGSAAGWIWKGEGGIAAPAP